MYKGIQYLRNKLALKKTWVTDRYDYYEMNRQTPDPSPVIPTRLQWIYNSKLGWCTKAVDSLANRLNFDGFENDTFNLWEMFKVNNPDVLFDSAIKSALISACCFVYISADDDGYPRMQVIDGKRATGIIDPITNLLTEGYAVLDQDDNGNPLLEAYFTAEETAYIDAEGNEYSIPNNAGYPLLVPIIYRPTANKPFGQSRISADMMDLQDKARHTITRAEVTAEFYSFPQKYVVGTSEDSDGLDTWKATISSFLEFTKDGDGDKPTLGQFQQGSVEPHISQFEWYAKTFAGITSLTIDDLGFVSDNPSSAEAIKAGHAEMEHLAVKAQATFGTGFLNTGFVAACLRDNTQYKRKQIYETKPVWKPIFALDNSAVSSFGDGVIKINQAVPNAITPKVIKRVTGLPIEIDE